MKPNDLIQLCAILATCALASAEEHLKRPSGLQREVSAAVLAKFDKDGDGKLSKPERQARREDRKAKILLKFDTDRDGLLSDTEREALRAEREAKRAKRLEKYDTNANGKLDAEEINAARAAGAKIRNFGTGPNRPRTQP